MLKQPKKSTKKPVKRQVTPKPTSTEQVTVLIENVKVWRDDCLAQNLLTSALFWGEAVLGLGGGDLDFYLVAKIHYQMNNFIRCLGVC